MPDTANFGITYPSNTGHTRIWEHLQVLADDADAALVDVEKQPCCIARRAVALSIPNNVVTAVTFDTEEFDNDGCFTASSTNVTVKTAGVYSISATCSFAINATGVRFMDVLVNGTKVNGAYSFTAGAGNPTTLTATCLRLCAVNDIVTMTAYQTSGGALNVEGPGWTPCRLAFVRVSAA